MRTRRSCLPQFLILLVLFGLVSAAAAALTPELAAATFGRANPRMSAWQRLSYAVDMIWNSGDLTTAVDPSGQDIPFTISAGESVVSLSLRMQQEGLIRNAGAFRSYLVWSGIDTTIQTGTYQLSPALTAVEIAHQIQSTSLTEVTFNILPGWRTEEIAAALPTSGLSIPVQDFLNATGHPSNPPYYLPAGTKVEGFLFPDSYLLPRSATAAELVARMLQDFTDHLSPELRNGFTGHGLTIDQAVTLASIVEKETVVDSEMPTIASVFYNRLAAGMPLASDPTVQFAIGYNPAQATWWTNPLSLDDLKIDSPYNTYIHPGLPPGPISNPGMDALLAVANPAQTPYLYFRARCDGSGLHAFSETFEQHLQHACP